MSAESGSLAQRNLRYWCKTTSPEISYLLTLFYLQTFGER